MGKKMYEQNDNTSVRKPITQQFFTRKAPSQEEQQEMAKQGYNWDGKNWRYVGTISDAGGKPSTDNRTAAERNKDYWKLSGASDRWRASWNNNTNPVKGALDNGLGYTNPVTAVANTAYDVYNAYDQLSSPQGLAKTWGLFKQGKLGKAAVSAAGDALAVADLIPGTPETPSVARPTLAARTTSVTRTTPRQASVSRPTVRLLESNQPRIAGALPTSETYSGTPFNQAIYNITSSLDANDWRTSYTKALLEQLKNGNYLELEYLKGRIPDEQLITLANSIPDAKYAGPLDINNLWNWSVKVNRVKSLREGPGDEYIYRQFLRDNPYSDNLVYQDFKDKFPGIEVYDASIRSAMEGPRTAENNQVLIDYLAANPDIQHRVPHYDLARMMTNISNNQGFGIPAEYAHIDANSPYDGSYPVQYYQGSYAAEGLDKKTMLENGLLARRGRRGIPAITGLFTDEDLRNLSLEQIKNFVTRSMGKYAEGSHGSAYQGGTTSHFLQYLLTRDQTARKDMEELLNDMNSVISSGYTPSIHSLSFDSFPIWEKQILNRVNKGQAFPVTNKQLQSIGVPHSFVNNNLGTVAKYEASPELLEALKTSYKPTVDKWGHIPTTDTKASKYLIENTGDPNIFMVTFDGKELGTFRQRSSEELMDMLNESRKKLYRKNMDLYPGDITSNGFPYSYNIPIITAITKKKGGKLNARLVKKKH